MKSRCVSLTGATGFLGLHIARAFWSRGWTIRPIVRPGNRKPLEHPGRLNAREASLRDVSGLVAAVEGSDVIVHAAGIVRARRAEEFDTVNVSGTRAVVAAANAAGARLVHLSSLAAIGAGTAAHPVHEQDPPHPVNAYGRSKWAAEQVVREAAVVPWIVLRPSAVYGPGDRGFLPLVRLARRGVFLLAAAEAMSFTFIYVEDVAEAIVRAAESDVRSETLSVGHPTPETTGAMLRGIASSLNRRYRPIAIPAPAVRLAGWIGDLVWMAGGRPPIDSSRVAEFTAPGFVCDVTRARERLGFTAAVGLPEGLERTVRWYRDQGWV